MNRRWMFLLAALPCSACLGAPSAETGSAALSSFLCAPDATQYGRLTAGAQSALDGYLATLSARYPSADGRRTDEHERALFDGLAAAGAMDGVYDPSRIQWMADELILASADRDIGEFRKATIKLTQSPWVGAPVRASTVSIEGIGPSYGTSRVGICLPVFGDFCQPDLQAIVAKHVTSWLAASDLYEGPTTAELSALFEELAAAGAVGGQFVPDRFSAAMALDLFQLRVGDGFDSSTEHQFADFTFRVLSYDRIALVRVGQRWVPWRETVEEDGTTVFGGVSTCEPPQTPQP